ncbi:MAG TPA: two-component regulator propeller domain-containing protein, partial [Ferruginibacter sp.]|nr:two-component regulator propeller domain-containing protein [Ferruginibacter sp.]
MPNPFKNHFIICIVAATLYCNNVTGQIAAASSTKYYVEHFGEDEGLPQNSVNNILPDKNDFLWIATEGNITRFNGNRFINVLTTPSIANMSFTRVKNFYYGEGDTIYAFSSSNRRIATIVNNKIVANESLIPNRRLLFINMHHVLALPVYLQQQPSLMGGWNLSLGGFEGTMYNKDTFLVSINGGYGVYSSTGKIGDIRFGKPVNNPRIFFRNKVIYLDDENNVNYYSISGFEKKEPLGISSRSKPRLFSNDISDQLFCVADSVLYSIDISSGSAKAVKILDDLQHPDDVSNIYQKDSMTIVAGTLHNGLYVYKRQYFRTTAPLPNGESDGFYGQQLMPDGETILTGNDNLFRNGKFIGKTKQEFQTNPYSSLKDSKGNYWYGYLNILLRSREIGVAPDTFMKFNDVPSLLFEDKGGRVWVFSRDQFGYILDGKFTEKKINGLDPGLISCMREDAQGRYLIGTRHGLFILNSINDTSLGEVKELMAFDVRYIFPDADEQTWICTYGNGLFLMNNKGVTAYPRYGGKLAFVHCIF